MRTLKLLLIPTIALISLLLSSPAFAQKAAPLGLNLVQDSSQDSGLGDAKPAVSSVGAACVGNTQPLPPQLLAQLEPQKPGSGKPTGGQAKGNSLNVSLTPFSSPSLGEGFHISWEGMVGEEYRLCWKPTGTWGYECTTQNITATTSNTWTGYTYADIWDLDCGTEYKIKVKRVGGLFWSKAKATTNSCPCADPCPEGGYYDGANCQMGEAPTGTTAFIYANNFYYTPVPTDNCPYPGSYWDGANCKVGDVPTGAAGFIYANHWYYAAYPSTTDPSPCPYGGYYDSANCQVGEAPWGTEAFIYNGSYYYTALPECPYPGSVYDSANCYVQPVPAGTNGFIWLNHWYYESCP